MDEQSFDAFTRGLTAIVPRRRTIALLAGVVSPLLTPGASPVAAACKKVGKKCDKNKDCCDGARCGGKKCKCKSGFSKCNKKCYDLDQDENHCGACDNACAPAATCIDGACVEGGYAFVTQWGSSGAGNGEFDGPLGLSVTADAMVYVADTGNHRIQLFSDDGDFVATWGTRGAGDVEFEFPIGIAVDPNGAVYVADSSNHRVQKLDGDGTLLDEWGSSGTADGQFDTPFGIDASVRSKIFVVDFRNDRVQKFDADGTHELTFGAGQLVGPRHVAIDDHGNVYVTVDAQHLEKYAADGTHLLTIGSLGSGDGQFANPKGVAVDADGNVYVVDQSNHRIQKLAPDGPFLTKWGSQGSGIGEFAWPDEITVDNQGNVYVLESWNQRIQKFAPA